MHSEPAPSRWECRRESSGTESRAECIDRRHAADCRAPGRPVYRHHASERLGDGPFAQIACVVKWAVTGFFAGLAFVVLLAFASRHPQTVSVRKLMVLVIVAGVLAWFFARVLFGVIGYEGF